MATAAIRSKLASLDTTDNTSVYGYLMVKTGTPPEVFITCTVSELVTKTLPVRGTKWYRPSVQMDKLRVTEVVRTKMQAAHITHVEAEFSKHSDRWEASITRLDAPESPDSDAHLEVPTWIEWIVSDVLGYPDNCHVPADLSGSLSLNTDPKVRSSMSVTWAEPTIAKTFRWSTQSLDCPFDSEPSLDNAIVNETDNELASVAGVSV